MNYQEALAYMYGLSDYERGGPYSRSREENLARESRLLELLGNPQHAYSCTLIAGTKGKGSTAAFIERVLREAGLRTGLYTQPDLHTFRERMRVRGRLISEDEVAALLPEVRAVVDTLQARGEFGPFNTYQVATALMFLYFARQNVEHAVLEVGLGGRLDATNVTQPLVSVITSISYDHMQVLGHTLTEIATEKAGIIKAHGTVVTSAQAPEALLAIAAVCQRQQARLLRVGPVEGDPAQEEVTAGRLPAIGYRYQLDGRLVQGRQRFTVYTPDHTYADLETPMLGEHQLENATTALAALELLRAQGLPWYEDALRAGFLAVRWAARMDVVGQQPTIVVDGAHNADSMRKLLLALRASFAFERLIMVLGVNSDKDLAGIARELTGVDVMVLTRMLNPRAATIEQLQAVFAEHARLPLPADKPQVEMQSASTSRQAMDLAVSLAKERDLICATGSLYIAGEVLRWAAARGDEIAAATIEGVDHSG